MTFKLNLSEKGFRPAIINIFKMEKQNLVTMTEHLGNMNRKTKTMKKKKKGNSIKTK